METILTPPLSNKDLENLKAGDLVYFTGIIYTARDAAHKKLVEMLQKGDNLPFDINGAVIYYAGPTPAKPGKPIGSAGPTTSGRMDAYAPILIEKGLKGMIGKGSRNQQVIDACVKFKAVYFGATGGAGALIAKSIKSSKIVAFEDLGPEAIRELQVENFPAIVVHDIYGNDLYKSGSEKYKKDIEILK